MLKKIFAVLLISTTFFISGCEDESAHVHDEQNTAQAATIEKKLPTFNAKTIDGKIVTNEIFAAKKITVLNIWGTFCPPCIGEMPELGEMARKIPNDAQIIGLVCDASDNSVQIQRAQNILQKANATFINIVPDENLIKFMQNVEAVPITIFVNSRGEVVGNIVVGANVEAYENELKKLLKE